jgi:hypothetical protein
MELMPENRHVGGTISLSDRLSSTCHDFLC